jgi:hypothetical protein
VDLEKEIISLSVKLAQAKNKLMMIEKENDVMRELRKELKTELIKVNAKINEGEILNRFLLENNSSRDELFEKILSQIKTLRELKIDMQKKDEKVKNSIIGFLTEEHKDKELLVEQSKEMKEFLEKIQEQIHLLKVPNFENLIKNKLNLAKLQDHNNNLQNLEIVQENENQDEKKNPNYLRKSMNYNSTGKNLFWKIIKRESTFKPGKRKPRD